jgi:hypothetical protein
MLAPTSSQSTVTTHSSFNTTRYNLAARNHVAEQQYAQQAHSGYVKKEMRSDVAHMLQVLENALLDDNDDEDETDLAASLSQRGNTLSADGGWVDTLEELLAVERTSPLDSQSHEVSATSAQSPSSSDTNSTAVPEDVSSRSLSHMQRICYLSEQDYTVWSHFLCMKEEHLDFPLDCMLCS